MVGSIGLAKDQVQDRGILVIVWGLFWGLRDFILYFDAICNPKHKILKSNSKVEFLPCDCSFPPYVACLIDDHKF